MFVTRKAISCHCIGGYVCRALAHWWSWLADRVSFCTLTFFGPANLDWFVLNQPEHCLYCEYCTVVLYAVPPCRLTPYLKIMKNCVCYVCHDRRIRRSKFTLKGTNFCFMLLIHLILILFAYKSIIFSHAKWPMSFPFTYWPTTTRPNLVRIRLLNESRTKLVPALGSLPATNFSIGGRPAPDG